MIKKKTLLVLGAGASQPYGLPTGAQLTRIICEEDQPSIEHGVRVTAKQRLHDAGFTTHQIDKFIASFRESGKASIDAFLEYRDDLKEIGKATIAAILLRMEDRKKLFSRGIEGNWYELLFERMTSPLEEFAQNNLSVITFNYDRSLSRYLATALSRSYDQPIAECYEILNAIPVVHVHGSLGPLPRGEDDSLDYGNSEVTSGDVRAAAKHIRVIHDDTRDHLDVLAEVRTMMSDAEIIYFLGFGFHDLNLRRLDVAALPKDKKVRCSAFGMTKAEIEFARHPIAATAVDFGESDWDVLRYLRERSKLA